MPYQSFLILHTIVGTEDPEAQQSNISNNKDSPISKDKSEMVKGKKLYIINDKKTDSFTNAHIVIHYSTRIVY